MKRTRTLELALLSVLFPPIAANADVVIGGTETVEIVGLVGLSDMNGNGAAEVGVVRTLSGDRAEVIIRDSATKQLVSTVEFVGTGLELVDVTAVYDVSGDGIPELAALYRHPDGPAVVQIKDAASGALFNRLRFYGKDWDVKAITSFDTDYNYDSNFAFRPDIGVLASRQDGAADTVLARDVIDGLPATRVQYPADPAREYRDVTTLIDLEGSVSPIVSTLSVEPDGRAWVDSIFLLWGSQSTIGFPNKDLRALGATAIAVAGLDDSTDNLSPDVAVLWRKANGQGVVEVRDVFGRWQSEMQFFGKEWDVVDMAGLPFLSGAYVAWAGSIAVLAVRDDGTEVAVQVRWTGSGEARNWISFGNLVAAQPE